MKELDEKLGLYDPNIESAELADIVDENGNDTTGVIIVVGPSKEEIEQMVNEQSDKGGNSDTKITTPSYEIVLTKKELNRLIKLVREM